ncbi:MAG TPA: TIGR03013 family XrtA/PEP-CTERM system glycosyltransferase [Stellaceae bacterium]|nr:TIGR03013 family XrtA/PEP-CTERM system glycosyltransferase [Stellaceae bacterium]
MLRIFGHFVPVPALALGLAEAMLLAGAFYLVNAPTEAAAFRLAAAPAQVSLGVAALAVLAMVAVGLYHHDVFLDPRLMAVKAVAALLLLLPLAAVATFVLSNDAPNGVEGGWVGWCLKAAFAWMAAVVATRTLFLRHADSERFRRPVLVLGTGIKASRIAEHVTRGAARSFRAMGFIHACGDLRVVMGAKLDLDRTDDEYALMRAARAARAREVVVATDERRGMPILQLLHCKIAGINVVDYLTFWERETRKVDLDSLQPSWLIFSDGFRQGVLIDAMKRAFDIIIAFLLLVFVLPVMLLAALAIYIEDGAPVLYRQDRVGREGRIITLLKFRSMRHNAESGRPQWATTADPRVTRVGAVLRQFRVDELPQLVNVLKGDMSFVGPRPERPYFVDELAGSIPFYRERHSVKPGITGWAQVNYPYGASLDDARQKLAYDLYYVKNRTLFLDFLILVQTVRVVLFHEGAR